MIEFVVGLVAILALLGCLLLAVRLFNAHTATLVQARAEAGRLSLTEPGEDTDILWTEIPEHILDWQPGSDTRTYTRDDTYTTVGSPAFDTVLDAAVADATAWDFIDAAAGNDLSALRNSLTPVADLGLIKGQSDVRTINLADLPAVVHLLYASPTIDVESHVWTTWLKGIY